MRRDSDRDREELTEDERIIQEAKDNFKRCNDWESDFRRLYWMDVKFANGDADNGWQWPDDLRKDREKNKRPALTINKTAQYVKLITNNARQNKPSISIKPMGAEASYDAAQIYEGIIRHIEYISSAQNIYDEAVESQVEGGIGYWRIIQKYTDDDSFDQELLIAPVEDHLGVFIDCDARQKDRSDARYGFIFEDMSQERFKIKYPDVDLSEFDSTETGLEETARWVRNDNVRVAEYYRILETNDKLIHLEDENGQVAEFKLSSIPEKYRKRWEEAGENYKSRDITKKQLEWYKIAGSKIIDRRKLKGKYIPIIAVVGIERVIQGKLERKGHVRALKDPQRMYNYNTSGQVEYGALATKTPWIVAKKSIEGNEVAWNNANRDNAAYLPFEHVDEDGNQMPPPMRPEAPGTSPAFLEGMRIAAAEMEMASGQQATQQENPALERTPRAIDARERHGETATYHYIDNLAIAIRYTGRVLIDLIPYIYDTQRVIQIIGKDDSQTRVTINPDMQEAYRVQQEQQDVTKVLFNPKVGKYEVESDVGPAYASQRQEAWNAFVQITTGAPELINEIGDLMFQSADFPLADKIAERIKRKIRAVTPWLLDDQPGPVVAQLNDTIQKQAAQIAELLERLAHEKIRLKGKDEMRDIDVYEAKTRRLTAEGNVVTDFAKLGQTHQELETQVHKTLHDMDMDHINTVLEANQATLENSKDNAA